MEHVLPEPVLGERRVPVHGSASFPRLTGFGRGVLIRNDVHDVGEVTGDIVTGHVIRFALLDSAASPAGRKIKRQVHGDKCHITNQNVSDHRIIVRCDRLVTADEPAQLRQAGRAVGLAELSPGMGDGHGHVPAVAAAADDTVDWRFGLEDEVLAVIQRSEAAAAGLPEVDHRNLGSSWI